MSGQKIIDPVERLEGYECNRRGFMRALGAMALPLLVEGCDAEQDEEFARPEFRGLGPNQQSQVSVQKALQSQSALLNDDTRCSLPAALAGLAGVGDQVRIIRNNSEYALYTVKEHRLQDNPSRLRLGLNGRLRLGTSGTFGATVTTAITSDLSDAEAAAKGEFVERLVDNGYNDGLVVIAPHGGAIESRTDQQAEYVTAALAGASSWICKGWSPGGGAWDRWHITSTHLSPNSFAGLGAIADRNFAYAVAFHGMSSGGVLIGGAGPLEVKQLLRSAIAAAIDDNDIPVTIAGDNGQLGGKSPSNVVNWLTAGGSGGIQIEQSSAARTKHWKAIAAAVANVYSGLV